MEYREQQEGCTGRRKIHGDRAQTHREAEAFFWANDTILGSSQKQGEMLVNAVNGSTDSIFGSEFLK